MRVMHLIVGLGTGGAETNLYRLVTGTDPTRFEHVVVSMMRPGPVRGLLEDRGVPVYSLNMRQGMPEPTAVLRFARLLRRWKPDLLQTWMYHADLLGTVTARLVSGPPVIWNIRNSNAATSTRFLSGIIARVLALVSRMPAAIISCSNAGRDFHARLGYSQNRMTVIFNGYDTAYFRPNREASLTLRNELGIPAGAPIVTNIARYHPVKDHAGFLAAARLIRNANEKAYFVLCGDGVTWENPDLVARIDHLNLREVTFLLGRRNDTNFVLAGSTVLVSASTSEGFPNVVAEAMACDTVCVATDVGDARHIVGNTGYIVSPGHPDELADAVLAAIHTAANPGSRPSGRARVAEHFALQKMIASYEALYAHTVNLAGNERKSVNASSAHRT